MNTADPLPCDAWSTDPCNTSQVPEGHLTIAVGMVATSSVGEPAAAAVVAARIALTAGDLRPSSNVAPDNWASNEPADEDALMRSPDSLNWTTPGASTRSVVWRAASVTKPRRTAPAKSGDALDGSITS